MKKKALRTLALCLCALTLLTALPVLAAPTAGYVAAGTPFYVGASNAQVGGSFSSGGRVQVVGQEGNFYLVNVSGTNVYIDVSSLQDAENAAPTSTTTSAGSSTSSTTAPAANSGYITNCSSNVNMRASASKSSKKLGTVNKNEVVTILGTEGDYTKVTTAAGTTGYVLSDYVASGTPGAASSGGSAASGAGATMFENPIQMASKDKTIYMRKTPTSSTKSKDLVKKLTGVKGHVFDILGHSGQFYYASYSGYTGYVKAADFVTYTPGATANLATGDKSKDKWGEIVKIDGTNIGSAYGKLYDNNIYCNGLNSKGEYYYNDYDGRKNYFYMLSPQNAPIAVLMSHNMRSSKTGGHDLHHIQNAWLGVSKCESCKASCANSKTSIFNISYEKHTQWQLIGFFEGSASMRDYAAVNFGVTGTAKQAWIDQILSYCTSKYKGAVLGSATSNDDIMMKITCGDKGSAGGTFLCMLLKGV